MDNFEKLRRAKGLTANDQAIVSYVLDHAEEIARLSSRELGRRTHTSASSVMRCCRHLGFESWDDFKYNIASDLKRAPAGTTSIAPGERALSASAKMAELEQLAIAQTRQSLSLDALQEAADLLVGADAICTCAKDTNDIIAKYADLLFSLARKVSMVRTSNDRIMRYAQVAPQGQVALLVSRGGNDKTILAAAKTLRERGVGTIALTTAPGSPLARECDVVLGCYYGEINTYGEAVWHVSANYVINTLFTMLFADSYEENKHLEEALFRLGHETLYAENAWDVDTMSRV